MADRVVRESFINQDPFDIVGRMPPMDDQDPECGYVLGWKSERLRNGSGMGWGGWEPFEFGDKYTGENGEKLRAYVPDPPRRMRGPDRLDNLVRRADVVLCRINADEFDRNQAASAAKSRERVKGLEYEEGVEVLPGVKTIGSGRQADKRPTFGNKTGEGKELDRKLSNR